MVFKKPGNGRDERSGRSSSRTTKADDRPKRSSSSRGSSSKNSESTDWNKPDKKTTTRSGAGDRRSSSSSDRKTSSSSSDKKSSSSSERKPYAGSSEHKSSFTGGEKKSFSPRKPYSGRPSDGGDDRRPAGPRKPYSGRVSSADSGSDRPKRNFGSDEGEKKSYSAPRNKSYSGRAGSSDDTGRPARNSDSYKGEGSSKPRERSGSERSSSAPREGGFKKRPTESFGGEKTFKSSTTKPKYDKITKATDVPAKTLRSRKEKDKDSGLIRLNRYIANAGICSRRKADELIEAGVVSVNNVVINELGHKVDPMKDEIRYNGELLRREKMVYVLLNKPKDYITTTEDPQERRTVMHLVEKASRERIYPIGRLDRNTTGLLLMTNDGDLADKLSHPRSNITKLYNVELNKSLVQGDMNKIQYGLELEDGLIKPDSISYVTGGTKREIGIQIHSGKNRIVRRIFEHLGYEVVKLDRVIYAGLTKKDLTRGRWRYLDEKEVIQLKHLV